MRNPTALDTRLLIILLCTSPPAALVYWVAAPPRKARQFIEQGPLIMQTLSAPGPGAAVDLGQVRRTSAWSGTRPARRPA